MISPSRDEYLALLRTDFMSFFHRCFRELHPATVFQHNPYMDVVASRLDDVKERRTKRQIINMPPRSLKSELASIAFPAFVLGHYPSTEIICVSYSEKLADKFALECFRIMQSDWYREIFATRLAPDKLAVSEFETTAGGCRVARSVGGSVLGLGGDLIIIDDALNADEAVSDVQRDAVNVWYDSVLLGRLNNLNDGAIVIVSQRLHEDDLVGHVLGHE